MKCPNCRGKLTDFKGSLECKACNRYYRRDFSAADYEFFLGLRRAISRKNPFWKAYKRIISRNPR
jgi:hypothetical protein